MSKTSKALQPEWHICKGLNVKGVIPRVVLSETGGGFQSWGLVGGLSWGSFSGYHEPRGSAHLLLPWCVVHHSS